MKEEGRVTTEGGRRLDEGRGASERGGAVGTEERARVEGRVGTEERVREEGLADIEGGQGAGGDRGAIEGRGMGGDRGARVEGRAGIEECSREGRG